MTKWKKLSHTIYQCKYHIVWCPKYRYRILKGAVAEFVEQTLRMLCEPQSQAKFQSKSQAFFHS